MQIEPPESCQKPPFVPFVQLAVRLPFDEVEFHSYPSAQFTLIVVPAGDGVEGEYM